MNLTSKKVCSWSR